MADNAGNDSTPGNHVDSGWASWGRLLARQALIVLTLLTVAAAASVFIDLIETTVPAVPLDACAAEQNFEIFSVQWSALLSPPGGAAVFCQWAGVNTINEQSKRSLTVQITEASNGLVQASITMRLPTSDPLIAKVRNGDAAQNPAAFTDFTVGSITVNQVPLNWSPPVLDSGISGTAEISQAGSLKSGPPETISAFFVIPASLRVTSSSLLVTGIQGSGFKVTDQEAHAISVQYGTSGGTTIDLAASSPNSGAPDSGSAGPTWWGVAASGIWQLVRSFAGDLFPAAAWIALFLAGRGGALGSAGRRAAWRRMDRVLAMTLLAHLAISAAVEITNQEGAASNTISSPGAALERAAMSNSILPVGGGYFAVAGGTILLIAVIIWGAAWWSRPVPSLLTRRPHRRNSATTSLLCLGLAIGVDAGLAWLFVTESNRTPQTSAPISDVGLTAVFCAFELVPIAGALWVAVPVFRAWLRSFAWVTGADRESHGAGQRRPEYSLIFIVPVACMALLLAVSGAVTLESGAIPLLLRWSVVVIAGTLMGLAVTRLLCTATGLRLKHGYPFAALVAAAIVAIPWGIVRSPVVDVGWWSVLTYALRIDDLLPLVLLAAGATAMRYLGSAPVTDESMLKRYRALGILTWFVVLSSSYTLAGTFSWSALTAAVSAVIGAWALMPADQVARASLVLGQSGQQQADAVRLTVRAGGARRLVPAYSKAMRDQVTAGKLSFNRAQRKISDLEQIAAGAADKTTTGSSPLLTTAEQRGFGSLTSRRPWRRGLWGTAAGALIGAPWVVLGLAGARFNLGTTEGYPELAILSAITPLVVRWAAYGFAFGYFYPLIRGNTGLGKAVWFTAVAAAPAVLSAVAQGHSSGHQWDRVALLIIQIATFATTLGILADRAVLRKYRLPAGRLVDLHNLWTVSPWASTLGVALATGIATVLIAGLQPFVIGLITPSTTPTPTITAPHTPGN